jgi:hypothetical protein
MEINGINMQITQVGNSMSTAVNGNIAGAQQSKQAAIDDSANSSGSQATSQINSLTNSDYIKEQIEIIMYAFPPFFPVGSPQRSDLLEGIKGVRSEIKNSSLPTETKETLAGTELTDAATDKEISAALEGVQQYTEEHSPAPSQSTEKSQTVNIVSIKI